MKVTVRYMAQLKQAAGGSSEEVEAANSASVQQLLLSLAARHPDLKRILLDDNQQLQSTILVFLDDEQVEQPGQTVLSEGAVVTLLSPIAGG